MSNPLGAGASSGGPEGRSCELTLRISNGRRKHSDCLKKIDPDLQLPLLWIFSLLDKSYKGNILDISPQRTFVCRWVVNVGRM